LSLWQLETPEIISAIEYLSFHGVHLSMKTPLSYIVIAAAVAVASWTMFEALTSGIAG
jgi:hypothetical protein